MLELSLRPYLRTTDIHASVLEAFRRLQQMRLCELAMIAPAEPEVTACA